MKSLTEQIIELMPEERQRIRGDAFFAQHCNVAGFNEARTEMINKIPEILSLCSKEIEQDLWSLKQYAENTYMINDKQAMHNGDKMLSIISQLSNKLK